MRIALIIFFILFFGCFYGSMKAITDSVRDYPENNRIIKYLESKGWSDFANEKVVTNFSFFRGIWHFSEHIKEFAMYGMAFICLCFKPSRKEVYIIGTSMILSFYLSGQLFYYLYHYVFLIN